MVYKVNEVYRTLQGEGFWTGRDIILVRLSGCNLKCQWCDTKDVVNWEMQTKELVQKIQRVGQGCRSVLITGGEPLLQNIVPLIKILKRLGYWVAMETNGMLGGMKERKAGLDFVSVSPKEFKHKELMTAQLPSEMRIVNDGTWTADMLCLFRCKFPWCKHWYISPMDVKKKRPRQGYTPNLHWTIKLLAEVNEKGGGGALWRLNVQAHKMIGLP